jgi:hypothetical protein
VFDPEKTFQVTGDWVQGIGCPDCAPVSDTKVRGLLIAKSGPTAVFAAGGATLKGVNGIILQAGPNLGWDIRTGSYCGAGAPRFNVTTTDGSTYFIGCNSPAPVSSTPASPSVPNGWTQLRYDPAGAFHSTNGFDGSLPGKTVTGISIVFDEGQDVAPFSSLAVLDNIYVNGVTIGK